MHDDRAAAGVRRRAILYHISEDPMWVVGFLEFQMHRELDLPRRPGAYRLSKQRRSKDPDVVRVVHVIEHVERIERDRDRSRLGSLPQRDVPRGAQIEVGVPGGLQAVPADAGRASAPTRA